MTERFRLAGVSPILHPGVPVSDPRIAGRGLIPHTEKCWSCMYGHLDMIRDFVDNDSRDYGIFCEDDILIDINFKQRLEHVLADFDILSLDTLLLGYLITHPLIKESNGDYAKLHHSIYVDIETTETTTFGARKCTCSLEHRREKLSTNTQTATPTIFYTFAQLHLCTIKTPIYRRIMSAKVGSLCAL